MFRVLMLAAVIGLVGAAEAREYTNPVIYADYSDPDVIRVGDTYYHVSSSFHFTPGIPVLKSKDLVNWEIIGHVLPKLDGAPEYDMPGPYELDDTKSKPTRPGLRYMGGVWAPAIRHHNGLFYVYWATPEEGVFMSQAKDPAGPWSKPVALKTGAGYEDPCPFWDEDGQAWLIHGKVGAGPLVLHRMSADGKRLLDEGTVVAYDPVKLPVLEGPKFHKRNGWYYIFAPIGGVGEGPQAVGRARDIRGPYEWRVVLEAGSTKVQAPHQGGYVETPSGQGWFLHFNSTQAFGRINHLQPVQWVDDWPIMGEPIAGSVAGQPVMRHAYPDTGVTDATERLQDSDEFDALKLGLQWQWNHNPDNARWSLTERSGFMRLKPSSSEHLVGARNTLTQMLTGPESRITTRLEVGQMIDGQRAGLVLFGVRPVWIGAVRENGVTRVAYASAGVEALGPVISNGVIELRAEITEDQMVRMTYRTGDGAFAPMGEAEKLWHFSWWKGSRPGLFTYVKGKHGAAVSGGAVDADWFRVETKK